MLTKEQLEKRKGYIGASDIGAIANLSPYKTAVEIYLDKTTDYVEDTPSLPAKWGNMLEPLIADYYAHKTGNTLELAPEPLRHPQYPFIAANIDRWVNDKEFIFEAKLAHLSKKAEWGEDEGNDNVPETYLSQVGQQSFIGDHYAPSGFIPKVDVGVGFYIIKERPIEGTDMVEKYPEIQEFKIYTYQRNKKLEEQLLKIGIHFWNKHVLTRIPPEPRTINDCSLLYPRAERESITADNEIELEINKMRDLKTQHSLLTSHLNESQIRIKDFMENNEVLMGSSGSVLATWRNTERGNRMFLIK